MQKGVSMKKITFIGVLLLAITLLGQKLVLANGEWKPYLSKDLKHYGFASHVVTEAFKKAGITVEYKWYGDSWKRAYKDAVDNSVDGTLVWSFKEERAEEMYYSKEAVISGKTDVIFHLKGKDVSWNTVADLEKYKFGGVLGYTYGKEIDQAISDKKIIMDRVKSDEQNFKKLLKGRIDCFISGKKVAEKLLAEKFTPEERAKITFAEKPTRVVTYHLLLNKKNEQNKAIMDKFDKAVKEMKDAGIYQKYVEDMEAGKYE